MAAAQGRQGRSTTVAKKYSIDPTSKNRAASCRRRQGPAGEAALDDAVFKAPEGQDRRPDQDAVRLLRLPASRRSRRPAADASQGGHADDQAAPAAEPAEGADDVRQGLPEAAGRQAGLPHGYVSRTAARPSRRPTRRSRRARCRSTTTADGPDGRCPRQPQPHAQPQPGNHRARGGRVSADPARRADPEALGRLDELTRRLRRECPWDREQDERSIVPHTVEEAYELADAAQRATTRSCSTSWATCSSRSTSSRCCSRSAAPATSPRSPSTAARS